MRLPFFVFFSLSFCFFSWAQSSEKEDFALHKELSAGINLNTNGGLLGGLAFRYAIPQNNNFFHIMNLEIV